MSRASLCGSCCWQRRFTVTHECETLRKTLAAKDSTLDQSTSWSQSAGFWENVSNTCTPVYMFLHNLRTGYVSIWLSLHRACPLTWLSRAWVSHWGSADSQAGASVCPDDSTETLLFMSNSADVSERHSEIILSCRKSKSAPNLIRRCCNLKRFADKNAKRT